MRHTEMGTLWLWANYFLCSLSLLIWKMGIIALTMSQGLREYYLKMICMRGRYTLYPKGRSLVTISIVIRCTPEGPLFLTWTRQNGDSWFPGIGKSLPVPKGFKFAVTLLDTGEKPPVLTRPTNTAGGKTCPSISQGENENANLHKCYPNLCRIVMCPIF